MKNELRYFQTFFAPARSYDLGVLRCPPARTRALEEEVSDRGFECWTPMEWVSKRLPRRRARVWELYPLLPSFLFVDLNNTPRALRIIMDLHIVGLRPMMTEGKFTAVGEEDMRYLASLDNREQDPKKAARRPTPFVIGEEVRLVDPDDTGVLGMLFGDSTGIVQGVNRDGEVLVAIKNSTVPIWVRGVLLQRTVVLG